MVLGLSVPLQLYRYTTIFGVWQGTLLIAVRVRVRWSVAGDATHARCPCAPMLLCLPCPCGSCVPLPPYPRAPSKGMHRLTGVLPPCMLLHDLAPGH